MKKLFTLSLLSILLAVFLTACRSSTDIIVAGLKVELTRIERANDGTVHVTWQIGNPNIVPYILSKTSHKITLNGTLIGTLDDTSPLGVPAQSHASRTGVLTLAGPAANSILEQAMAKGSAAYQMESTIMLLILDDIFEKAHLNASGTVPVAAK